jgi:hypothetical protein
MSVVGAVALAAACSSTGTGTATGDAGAEADSTGTTDSTVTVDATADAASITLGTTTRLAGHVELNGVANGAAIVSAVATQGATELNASLLFSTEGNYFGDIRLEPAGEWSIVVTATLDGVTATGTTSVIVTAPSCTDGVRNGVEMGTDCGGDCAECQGPPGPLIGTGDHTASSVTLVPIVTDLLTDPSDLAFDPSDPSKLWITDRAADSVIYVENPGLATQTVTRFADYSQHFLEEVVTIAIGSNGNFGTCGDSRNTYGGQGAPNDFMGPVLWSADPEIFKSYGPDASASHLDMLHNSANCMGMAWDHDNAYYVANGRDGTLDWYDFMEPHCPGCDDHSDGTKKRFNGVTLTRVEGVPSHMELLADGWLYVADTGSGRVIRVDVASGTPAGQFQSYSNEQPMVTIAGATVEEFIPPSPAILFNPSGLVWYDDVLYVSDAANGQITAFDSAGKRINILETGLGEGALAGIDVGADGKLYMVDRNNSRVVRLDP